MMREALGVVCTIASACCAAVAFVRIVSRRMWRRD